MDADLGAQSKIVTFLEAYKFRVEPDAVLPCEPKDGGDLQAFTDAPPPPPEASPIPAPELAPDVEPLPTAGPMMATMAAASVLNKSVANKSVFNKAALNKNKNKNKNKAAMDGGNLGVSQLIPAFELRRLHQQPSRNAFTAARRFTWEMLDILPPPGPDYTRLETTVLLSMQRRDRERARRLPDIQSEATISVSEFTRALHIEDIGGFEQTERLFQAILTACEYVGLIYKSQFNRLRPNQIEPLLRPLLAVPAHEAYPSNHAFQCFSIVFAFSTILPEHPATDELARIAQNVAENREWAGLHYPSDTQAGRDLARRFAPYLHDAFGPLFQAVHDEWI